MDASPTEPGVTEPRPPSPTIQMVTVPAPQAPPVQLQPAQAIGPQPRGKKARHLVPPPGGHVRIRGATSVGSLFTGALVAWAAVVLFALIARGAASYAGYKPAILDIGGAKAAGLLTAAAIGLGLFLAFLWGGYSAGRMSRGRGWIHGFAAAVLAAIAAALGIGLAALVRPGPGFHLGLHLPAGYPPVHFRMNQGLAAAGGVLVALAAAVIGGALGSGWHGRLERRAMVEEQERVAARDSFKDLREALSQPEPIEPDDADGTQAGPRPNVFPGTGTPNPGITG